MDEVETSAAWWRSAVIYQVYPRSFADSNGDGVGDLPGVTARLPYLAALGVDAVWLSPFYLSPMADHGYDVADYRDVDPLFGTLADFDTMVVEAHRLNLRIIIDVVPNHSSSEHQWFKAAVAAQPGSAERDRYIFRDGSGEDGSKPPNDWESVFGGPAWTRLADGQWYLHLFDAGQPDFNWRNPAIRDEFVDVLRFWLDRGVDGFRIDVAHSLVKAEGLPDAGLTGQHANDIPGTRPYYDQDEVHEIYRDWRKVLDSYPGERMAVAEAWAPTPERLSRYIRPDELHQAFNFHYLMTPWSATELRAVIDRSMAACDSVGAPPTWVLSNHDKIRHVTRYGGGAVGTRRARAAILLMLALPGSAYIYQGEELGLPEVTDLPDEVRQDPIWRRTGGAVPGRDGCRVPIPWSGEQPPFDFSPPGSALPWLPIPAGWATMTAERSAADPGSMLSLYRQALRVRRSHPALGGAVVAGRPGVPAGVASGDGASGGAMGLRWHDAPAGVLVFERDPGFVCTVNLTDEPVTLPEFGQPLLASGPVEGQTLAPDTTVWWSARN